MQNFKPHPHRRWRSIIGKLIYWNNDKTCKFKQDLFAITATVAVIKKHLKNIAIFCLRNIRIFKSKVSTMTLQVSVSSFIKANISFNFNFQVSTCTFPRSLSSQNTFWWHWLAVPSTFLVSSEWLHQFSGHGLLKTKCSQSWWLSFSRTCLSRSLCHQELLKLH